jgi:MFS family permease
LGAAGKSALGGAFSRAWVLRKSLYKTKRSSLVSYLAIMLGFSGGLLLAQGVLTGWFLAAVAPSEWRLEDLSGRYPFLKSTWWLLGILLVLAGLFGLAAGLSFAKRRAFAAYSAVLFFPLLLALGGFGLYAGIKFGSAFFGAFGAIDIVLGLSVYVILSLCWYTLDPLGLRWAAPADGTVD